ncbi:MAG: hypothetical protein V4547_01910 [Bacteroidota bacterium]
MERNYDQKTLGLLWGKSGGICASPECENELVIKNIDEIVGHICHIVGLKGPRADSSFPKDKLNKYENLVLMCRHHHGIIDIDILTNTVEKVAKIKKDHEKIISERLNTGKPWDINVSQIYYLNIPRLSILSEFKGTKVDFDFLKDYKDLHSIGFSLASILHQFKSLFTKIKPNIIEETSITEIDNKLIGLTFSYNSEFRTKNNPRLDYYQEGKTKLKGDINKDPQIYKQVKDFKLILTIDPKWIATTTAFVNLRPSGGKGLFAGIATIKHIDFESKLILATPLLIGIPKSPLDDFF